MSAAAVSMQHCAGPKPASEHVIGTPDGVLTYFTWLDIAKQY